MIVLMDKDVGLACSCSYVGSASVKGLSLPQDLNT